MKMIWNSLFKSIWMCVMLNSGLAKFVPPLCSVLPNPVPCLVPPSSTHQQCLTQCIIGTRGRGWSPKMLKAGVSIPGAAQLAQDCPFLAAAEWWGVYVKIKSPLNLTQKNFTQKNLTQKIIGMSLGQGHSLLETEVDKQASTKRHLQQILAYAQD